ncbi:class I SAM-dependent methyltransferase [Pelagibacteraceae bacterium]|nr:class I SAM-dependent methyltransferase [Pelagibacteraceae bacterium]
MNLVAKLFDKTLKEGGIILIDSSGQKFICGRPDKKKPVIVKLLKKNLNWKIILNADLAFPEAYMNGDLIIENSSLAEFLNLIFKNVGRKEITFTTHVVKRLFHFWRFISNYNLPGKSKKDVQHHYDVGGAKGEKLYDIFLDKKHRQYSCAYFKNSNESLEEAQQNKIDHIIKKLNIKPGQKILDIGCGWGGLAFEIAKQKNVKSQVFRLAKIKLTIVRKNLKKKT